MSSKTVKAGRWFRTKVEDVVEQADLVDETALTAALADYVPNNDPEANVADVTVTGTYADDDDAIETAINGILAILVAKGLMAAA